MRPRDDLVYVTYNRPGKQVARFALRGDRTMFLFVFRAPHEDAGVTPKEQLHDQFADAGWECPHILAAVADGLAAGRGRVSAPGSFSMF